MNGMHGCSLWKNLETFLFRFLNFFFFSKFVGYKHREFAFFYKFLIVFNLHCLLITRKCRSVRIHRIKIKFFSHLSAEPGERCLGCRLDRCLLAGMQPQMVNIVLADSDWLQFVKHLENRRSEISVYRDKVCDPIS